MYHILSLTLGLLAWGLGSAAAGRGRFGGLSFASLSLCGISLTLQFYELRRLGDLEDSSAFYDTIEGVTIAATVLLVITLALNIIALAQQGKGRKP